MYTDWAVLHTHIMTDGVEGVAGVVDIESDADGGQGRECETGGLSLPRRPGSFHRRQ